MQLANRYNTEIDTFFDYFGYLPAQKILSQIIKTACSSKIWPGATPSQVLLFYEQYLILMKAAFAITETNSINQKAIIKKSNAVQPLQFTPVKTESGNTSHPYWKTLPHHLSQKEFLNPYKAFEKITTYREFTDWKQILYELHYYALSKSEFDELPHGYTLIKVNTYLHKLIDAAHLIYIRSIRQDK
jgi:hypothetical protein